MGEKKEETATKPVEVVAAKKGDDGVIVVLKLDMHCEGCGKKIKRVLKHYKGVEDVKIDYAGNKLTVIGNVDPTAVRDKVAERIKRKVELVSTVAPKKETPPPSSGDGENKSADEKPAEKKPAAADEKSDEKKEEKKKEEGEKKASPSPPPPPKEKLFARKQEACRKDVERAFGVLQSRFAIVAGPSRFWSKRVLHDIMTTCIIMHNMIIEDERDVDATIEEQTELPPAEVEMASGEDARFQEFLARHRQIRNREAHIELRNDLIEHLWSEYTNSEN